MLSVKRIRQNSIVLRKQVEEVTSLLKQIEQDRKTLRRGHNH
jgi:hypothetical protein